MLNPDYLDGYDAFFSGEPNNADKPDIWQAGWCDAADDDARNQTHSENVRWIQ